MIKTTNLIKNFYDYSAISSLDLEIPNGSIYGLVGPNGSGKSTFLRIISGVYYPTSGSATVEDKEIYDNVEAKSKIFFVSDDMFFDHVNIQRTADYYKGIYPSWSQERYNLLMERFPLDIKKPIKTFSKGMRRQAALIIAMSCQPEYMLLDEAFDGLDPVIRIGVRKLLCDQVAETGMTVIIASHNLKELEDLCDTIAIIHMGKKVMMLSTDSIGEQFCKAQVIFKNNTTKEDLTLPEILSINSQGSMMQIIARGKRDNLKSYLENLGADFIEFLPINLEEVFVYEMEAAGYDYNNVLF